MISERISHTIYEATFLRNKLHKFLRDFLPFHIKESLCRAITAVLDNYLRYCVELISLRHLLRSGKFIFRHSHPIIQTFGHMYSNWMLYFMCILAKKDLWQDTHKVVRYFIVCVRQCDRQSFPNWPVVYTSINQHWMVVEINSSQKITQMKS